MKYRLTDKGRAMRDILGPAPAGAIYINPAQLELLEHRGVTKHFLISTGIYEETPDLRGKGVAATGPEGELAAFTDVFYDYRSDEPMSFGWYQAYFETEYGGSIRETHMDKLVSVGFLEGVPED